MTGPAVDPFAAYQAKYGAPAPQADSTGTDPFAAYQQKYGGAAPQKPHAMSGAEISRMMGHTLGVGTSLAQRLSAAAQGATLNLAGLAIPGIKSNADELAKTNPQTAGLAAVAGGAMVPGLTLAKLFPHLPSYALPLIGAAEGGVAGAAGAQPGQRAGGALMGAGLGAGAGALPIAAEGASNVLGRVGRYIAPEGDVVRNLARALHGGAVPLNTLSDQPPTISLPEALARTAAKMPGANIPAALAPEATKAVRDISAHPVAAAAAQDQASAGIDAVRQHVNGLHGEYQAIQNGPLGVVPVEPDLRRILSHAGVMEGLASGETQPVIAFTRLQEIRQQLNKDLQSSSPQQQRILRPAMQDLENFMNTHFPAGEGHRALPDIDADYAYANVWHNSDGTGLLDKYQKMLKGTGASQAAQGVAGTDAVSPGGTLVGRSGIIRTLSHAVSNQEARRGAIAARLMAQPSDVIPPRVAAAGDKLRKLAGSFFTAPPQPQMPPVQALSGALPTLADLLRQLGR